MDLDDYPLLNEPNVMLVALKTATAHPAEPGQCIDMLLRDLRRVGHEVPEDLAPLRRRVAAAFHYLCIAGLLDPDEDGRCTLTERGRKVLDEHPAGIDASVLVVFPEFRSYVRSRRTTRDEDEGRSGAVEPKRSYNDGWAAFMEGRGITDNPYPFDANEHLEWENGWCEARDETSGPNRASD